MSNLNYTIEKTLPAYEVITHQSGVVTGIRVRRSGRTVHYHRTGRGASELFDSPKGELHKLFLSTQKFASFLEDKLVLDLGCGNGKMVSDLSKLSASIIGLDLYLNPEQKQSPYFVQGDAFRMPFSDASFDGIIATWSVFHYEPLAQIGALLRETHRVLKPGASLIVPAVEDPERMQQIKIGCRRLKMDALIVQPSNIILCKK